MSYLARFLIGRRHLLIALSQHAHAFSAGFSLQRQIYHLPLPLLCLAGRPDEHEGFDDWRNWAALSHHEKTAEKLARSRARKRLIDHGVCIMRDDQQTLCGGMR